MVERYVALVGILTELGVQTRVSGVVSRVLLTAQRIVNASHFRIILLDTSASSLLPPPSPSLTAPPSIAFNNTNNNANNNKNASNNGDLHFVSDANPSVIFKSTRFVPFNGIVGHVFGVGRAVNVADAINDARYVESVDLLGEVASEAGGAAVPLLAVPCRDGEGQIVAVIFAFGAKKKQIDDGDEEKKAGGGGGLGGLGGFCLEDQEMLTTVADCAGATIGKIRLMQIAKRAAEQSQTLTDVLNIISETGQDHNLMISKVISMVYRLISVERVTLFLLNDGPPPYLTLAVSVDAVGVKIPLTQGIAGFVATSGQPVIIDDVYSDPRFDSSVDHATGFRTMSILCVPIRLKEGKIIGVLQAVNKMDNGIFEGSFTDISQTARGKISRFGPADRDLLLSFASQVGTMIHNCKALEASKSQQRKLAALLDVIKTVGDTAGGGGGIRRLVQTVIDAVYKFVSVDRVTLFLVDSYKREVWLAQSEDTHAEGIRIPFGVGIVGSVASSGEILNVPDAYKDNRFDPSMDKRTGFHTQSVLAVPVKDKANKPIAILMAINKRMQTSLPHSMGAVCCNSSDSHFAPHPPHSPNESRRGEDKGRVIEFDKNDEELLLSFCNEIGYALKRRTLELAYDQIMGGRSISSVNVSSFVSLWTNQTPLHLSATITLSRADPIARGSVISRVLSGVETKSADELNFDTNVFRLQLRDMLLYLRDMFVSCRVVETFSVPLASLDHFLTSVSCHYNDVPFHNFHHAFHVAMMTFLFLKHTNAHLYLTQLDVLGCLLAALCHDLDHPGVNNGFLINAESELALTHNDTSVLENHHSHTAFQLLKETENDILVNMRKEEKRELRRVIVSAIIATDMQFHRKQCDDLVVTESFDISLPASRQKLVNTIIHCADLSGQTMKREYALEWGRRVLAEYTKQVEKETAENLPITPFMAGLDNPKAVNKTQLGFCDYVLIPLWAPIVQLFPQLQPLLDNLESNRDYYGAEFDRLTNEEEEQLQHEKQALPAPA